MLKCSNGFANKTKQSLLPRLRQRKVWWVFMETELEYVNPHMLAERELMYRTVARALEDYRNRITAVCISCGRPVWECAWKWLNGDECYEICELMQVSHDAMLDQLNKESK